MGNPITLTQDELDAINAALESTAYLKEEMRKAKAAGIELPYSETHVEGKRQQLQNLKNVYWPNGKNGV